MHLEFQIKMFLYCQYKFQPRQFQYTAAIALDGYVRTISICILATSMNIPDTYIQRSPASRPHHLLQNARQLILIQMTAHGEAVYSCLALCVLRCTSPPTPRMHRRLATMAAVASYYTVGHPVHAGLVSPSSRPCNHTIFLYMQNHFKFSHLNTSLYYKNFD